MVRRPLTRTDVAAIYALTRQCETADHLPLATSFEELREIFDEPYFSPATDSVGIEIDGQLAAWSRTSHEPSGVRLERAFLTGFVDPRFRGQGIGTELVAWGVDRASEQLGSHRNDLPLVVRGEAYEVQKDVALLYVNAGFKPVRWHDELIRPLDDVGAVRALDGVSIMPWDPTHQAEYLTVLNDSFADHWGSTPWSAESWVERLASVAARTDLSFVAAADAKIVGLCLNAVWPDDELVTGRRDGWAEALGVLRPWRRRGVASALIEHSLLAFRASGMTHAMIGVDTANPTGAASLYRSLGFEPLNRSTTFELELPVQASP